MYLYIIILQSPSLSLVFVSLDSRIAEEITILNIDNYICNGMACDNYT